MASYRSLFPCTRELAYLNTATYGPGPTPVMEVVHRSLDDWSHGRGDWLEWEAEAEEARRSFARLLRVAPETIALLPTVSAAAAQVASALPEPTSGRSRIVVGEGEFRSNLYPWLAQERRGFDVSVLPFRDGRPDLDRLAERVDERTALVAISSVQSSTGFRLSLPPVVELCREHGAELFLDGTQTVGALALDVAGVDYVAVSGYKWLFAPRGTAFLYVAPHRLESVDPIAPGWKSPENPYADYYGLPYDLAPRASRLDYALPWHCWVGAAEGLRLIERAGVETIEAHALGLARRFREGLAPLGLESLFDETESSHIVGFGVPDPARAERELREHAVVAAVRRGYVRVSFALFNDETDVDRALGALSGRA